jgi:Asp-tRNA(Asn)/Glu-tRNA(Gln) amidotransferase C subunit
LVEEHLEETSKAKTRSKTRTILEYIDNNNNIYGDDFQEFWKNYIVNKAIKGHKAKSESRYIALRKNGVSKEELSNALANYTQHIKQNPWQSTKRVEFWLNDYKCYIPEDYTNELKDIENKLKEIEPLANIQIKEKRINIVLPTFEKLRAYKTSISNVIKPLCNNIGYQYYLQSNDNSNQS